MMSRVSVLPGACSVTFSWASEELSTFSPLMPTMMSPGCNPAFAPGVPGSTFEITAPCSTLTRKIGREVLQQDTDIAARNMAGLDQLIHDRLGEVGGNRKAQADVAAFSAKRTSSGQNQRIHADHLAVGINKSSARVAGIDGGVGLDEALNGIWTFPAESSVLRAHNAHGDCMLLAEGVADREHDVTHTSRIRIGKLHHGQV